MHAHLSPQRDVHTGHDHLEVAFEFRKMRFVFNEATSAFERLRFPVHEPFDYYLKANGACACVCVCMRVFVCVCVCVCACV
jgi:hypothetical protein